MPARSRPVTSLLCDLRSVRKSVPESGEDTMRWKSEDARPNYLALVSFSSHMHVRTRTHAHACTHARMHTRMLQCPRVHLPSSRRREGKEARVLLPRSADHLLSVTVAKGFNGPSHCLLVSLSPSAFASCAESPDPLQNRWSSLYFCTSFYLFSSS